MPQQVTALRVIIASPSDTSDARAALVAAINEWNDLNTSSLGVVLVPTLWEISSSPEMTGRPQAIINRQVVDRCDILIGTFWTRIGTPTGVAVSGTNEEIEIFIERGAPVLLYFSNQPATPATLDPDQLRALASYKAQLQSRGLCGEYESVAELIHKVQRDLQRAVVQFLAEVSPPLTSPASSSSPPEETEEDVVQRRAAREAAMLVSELRGLLGQYEVRFQAAVEGDDVNELRHIMGAAGRSLSRLLGIATAASAATENSIQAQALRGLAFRAVGLERFDVYIDGGTSWSALVSAAEDVFKEVRQLATENWSAVFSASTSG